MSGECARNIGDAARIGGEAARWADGKVMVPVLVWAVELSDCRGDKECSGGPGEKGAAAPASTTLPELLPPAVACKAFCAAL